MDPYRQLSERQAYPKCYGLRWFKYRVRNWSLTDCDNQATYLIRLGDYQFFCTDCWEPLVQTYPHLEWLNII